MYAPALITGKEKQPPDRARQASPADELAALVGWQG
jgi:hypothetical protein